jgi:hypothetical protein
MGQGRIVLGVSSSAPLRKLLATMLVSKDRLEGNE